MTRGKLIVRPPASRCKDVYPLIKITLLARSRQITRADKRKREGGRGRRRETESGAAPK